MQQLMSQADRPADKAVSAERHLLVLWKSDCLGCVVFVVCLLLSFFLLDCVFDEISVAVSAHLNSLRRSFTCVIVSVSCYIISLAAPDSSGVVVLP